MKFKFKGFDVIYSIMQVKDSQSVMFKDSDIFAPITPSSSQTRTA